MNKNDKSTITKVIQKTFKYETKEVTYKAVGYFETQSVDITKTEKVFGMKEEFEVYMDSAKFLKLYAFTGDEKYAREESSVAVQKMVIDDTDVTETSKTVSFTNEKMHYYMMSLLSKMYLLSERERTGFDSPMNETLKEAVDTIGFFEECYQLTNGSLSNYFFYDPFNEK